MFPILPSVKSYAFVLRVLCLKQNKKTGHTNSFCSTSQLCVGALLIELILPLRERQYLRGCTVYDQLKYFALRDFPGLCENFTTLLKPSSCFSSEVSVGSLNLKCKWFLVPLLR